MSTHQFKALVALNDTEIEVDVEFDFQPEEKANYFYPGCKAEISIESAKVGATEIPDWLFNCISQQLAEDAWEFIKKEKETALLDKADYLYEQQKYA